MSTADHPQTDGQTERVNRVLEDVLRSVCVAEPIKWSTQLAQVEFALNNTVHASAGFTPFSVNGLGHPRTPLSLPPASELGEGGVTENDSRGLTGVSLSVKRNLFFFIETRRRSALASATLWLPRKTDNRTTAIAMGVPTQTCSKTVIWCCLTRKTCLRRPCRLLAAPSFGHASWDRSRLLVSMETPTRWICHR
jgi:hypothetical protein